MNKKVIGVAVEVVVAVVSIIKVIAKNRKK